jgi:RES domain
MNEQPRHDRALLDALDQPGSTFSGNVWRIVRAGRDPLKGSTLKGRWSGTGDYSVLYTSCDREGAMAEIGYRLSLEPIWPSRLEHLIHELKVDCSKVLDLGELSSLAKLGVNIDKYKSFDYDLTARISSAANFLEFDAMLVPCARYSCKNLVIFNERPNAIAIVKSESVDWGKWRSSK